jgi:hypothetical protein
MESFIQFNTGRYVAPGIIAANSICSTSRIARPAVGWGERSEPQQSPHMKRCQSFRGHGAAIRCARSSMRRCFFACEIASGRLPLSWAGGYIPHRLLSTTVDRFKNITGNIDGNA